MMPIFDPSTDFATVVDGLALVTLRARDGSETPVAHALRRAVTVREAAASDGKYTASDVVFHLSAAETGRPELGSLIVDALGQWTILEVALETLGARWRCICRDLAISAGLDTLVTIQKASYTKGAGGALEPIWSDLYTNERAKIQPVSAERLIDHQAVGQTEQALVFFTWPLPLTPQHRIVGPDGTTYRFLSWEDAQRIDALFTARVEVTR